MKRRLIIGPLLIAALLGILWLDERVLGRATLSRVLLWLLVVGALHEAIRLVRAKVEHGPGLFLFGSAAVVAVVTPFVISGAPVPGLLLALGALFAGGIRFLGMAPIRSATVAFPEAALLAGVMLYTAGLAGYIDRLLVQSVPLAFAVIGISKVSDIAGYLVGTAIGRRRIAPAVSPKKSWEGSIAGVLASGGLAAFLQHQFGVLGIPVALSLAMGLLIGAASLFGDLIESGLKRWAGVKDSSALLPEFGGFLDLLDGTLVAAPVALFCLNGQ